MSRTCLDNPVKVHWPKTFAAWSLTGVVMLVFAMLVEMNLTDIRIILYVSMIWLGASIMMVLAQHILHMARCIRLRHYLLAYPIVVSPILIFGFVQGMFGPLLGIVVSLVPTVISFWCVYALVLRGVSKKQRDESTMMDIRALDYRLIGVSALAISLASSGVLALNHLLKSAAMPLLEGEAAHPSLVLGGALPSLVVIFWGTVVQFVLLRAGRSNPWSYLLGFSTFILGYLMFILMAVTGVLIWIALGLVLGGEVRFEPASISPTFFMEQAAMAVVHSLFPVTVIAGGLLLWWVYHRALPRIRLPFHRNRSD